MREAAREAARLAKQVVLYTGPPPPKKSRVAEVMGTRLWVAGICVWCDQHFVILDQRTAKYCRPQCAKSHAEARRGRFRIKPSVRQAIYKRDKWTCQLCKQPVDPLLPYSNKWSATLDHIECQSWALVPDHRPTNLRLAHRLCNSMRNDETYLLTVLAA